MVYISKIQNEKCYTCCKLKTKQKQKQKLWVQWHVDNLPSITFFL